MYILKKMNISNIGVLNILNSSAILFIYTLVEHLLLLKFYCKFLVY